MDLRSELRLQNICSTDQLMLYLENVSFDELCFALERAGLAEEVMEAVNADPDEDEGDEADSDETESDE